MGMQERIRAAMRNERGGTPPARVRDAKGKVLEIGDEVLVVNSSQEFRIASIRPILQPGAPPNVMEVILVSKLHVAAPRDQSIEGVYQLRHAKELGEALFPGQGHETSPEGDQGGGEGQTIAQQRQADADDTSDGADEGARQAETEQFLRHEEADTLKREHEAQASKFGKPTTIIIP